MIAANVMFVLPAVEWSKRDRSTWQGVFAEVIVTSGLLLVIFRVVRAGRASVAAFTVGACIAAAYYFTSSTSFANPAVTLARTFSDTFAGIELASAPMFVVAQLVGAAVALATFRLIYPDIGEVGDQVVVPHDATT